MNESWFNFVRLSFKRDDRQQRNIDDTFVFSLHKFQCKWQVNLFRKRRRVEKMRSYWTPNRILETNSHHQDYWQSNMQYCQSFQRKKNTITAPTRNQIPEIRHDILQPHLSLLNILNHFSFLRLFFTYFSLGSENLKIKTTSRFSVYSDDCNTQTH